MIEIVDGHLACQRNQIGKVQNAKLSLPNHIPSWNIISGSCISKPSGQKFTSFLRCYFFPMPMFSLQLAFTFAFTWLTCAKKHLAAKSDKNIVKGERSIKAAQKDPSATIAASICLTSATVVGSINATESWQRQTWPPSFLLLLSCKMDLAIPQWSIFHPCSQMIYYNYCFCHNYFCTCFLQWCAGFHMNNLGQNWGCSMTVMI